MSESNFDTPDVLMAKVQNFYTRPSDQVRTFKAERSEPSTFEKPRSSEDLVLEVEVKPRADEGGVGTSSIVMPIVEKAKGVEDGSISESYAFSD